MPRSDTLRTDLPPVLFSIAMDATSFFFYLFSAVMLLSAFRVVTVRNPVHAVLYLMLTFSQATGLWLLLRAEFLAIILILVYLGAVMVLFLFVVMMLDAHVESMRRGFWRNFPLALIVGVLISIELAAVVIGGFHSVEAPPMAAAVPDTAGYIAQHSNTAELGRLLYTEYLFPLEVVVVILLVAMISAIALTLRKRKDNKAIEPGLQLRVQPKDRIQLVNVATVQRAPAAPETDNTPPEAAS